MRWLADGESGIIEGCYTDIIEPLLPLESGLSWQRVRGTTALPWSGAMGIFVGLLYGLIGSAYLVYGKRQGDTWFIFIGFTLLIFPYFITNPLLAALVGTLLMLLPIARVNGWF